MLSVALAMLGSLLAGCGGIGSSSSSNMHAATSGESGKEQTIHIDNFSFAPAEVAVAVGTKVTWINRDDVPHTATSTAKPKVFDSKTLDTDQTFSFVFDKAGTYEYFCAVHPKMTGKVIVK